MFRPKMKLFETALLTALCLALCAGTWAEGRQTALSENLVRLHVVAASDDEYEQALKLRVRDAVLAYLEPELEGAENSAAARELISARLEGIARAAYSAAEGRGVSVSFSQEDYPTRQYEGFALPAGEYDSLRVVIGEGAGHNWWCVVFPPLCTAAACDWQDAGRDAGLAEDDLSLMAEEDQGYQLRFRSVELWEKLRQWLGK